MGPLGMLDGKFLHLEYICNVENFWKIVQCWFWGQVAMQA